MEDNYDEYFMKQLQYMDSNPYETVNVDNDSDAAFAYGRTRSQTRNNKIQQNDHMNDSMREKAMHEKAMHEKAMREKAMHEKAMHEKAMHEKAEKEKAEKEKENETVDIKTIKERHSEKFSSSGNLIGASSIKNYFFLFIIFLFVSSDFFVNNMLSGSALQGRTPTSSGVVIQGIVMVVLFAVFNYLDAKKII